ncbi:GPN-loop GTPase 2 [Cyanidiococcus yangmingshanensis]|uniref:GPN-loop GTPase n=1 Tax=Cyanidiococcus yangmingshanensis TaxID=2690220 RepID=A0A7J7IHN9_9RHOD|nr:GPN-loop GTPase 2 [Cyanidiococcus yangmingshanensis]
MASGKSRPLFAQIVVGPPGSGKSTYCAAVSRLLRSIGRRHVLINLDPAIGGTETLPYEPDIDIRELVVSNAAMERFHLGPNGALMYCMEYLLENIDWLERALVEFHQSGNESLDHTPAGDTRRDQGRDHSSNDGSNTGSWVDYIIIDMPGQVELYAHHNATRDILRQLTTRGRNASGLDLRAVVVNLIDAQYCMDTGKFLSASLIALMTMLNIGLPHVNLNTIGMWLILIALLSASRVHYATDYEAAESATEGFLQTNTLYQLDVYAEGEDLLTLAPADNTPSAALSRAVAELLDDYGLVRFLSVSVFDPPSLLQVLEQADRASGYCYIDRDMANILSSRSMPKRDGEEREH